jgi:hypothetical protein
MGRDIKGLTRTPTYATIMNRFDTNLICPRISPLPSPSICPFLMMFVAVKIFPRAFHFDIGFIKENMQKP